MWHRHIHTDIVASWVSQSSKSWDWKLEGLLFFYLIYTSWQGWFILITIWLQRVITINHPLSVNISWSNLTMRYIEGVDIINVIFIGKCSEHQIIGVFELIIPL